MASRFYQSIEEPIGSCVRVSCDLDGKRFAVVDADGSALSLHNTKAEAEVECAMEHSQAAEDGSASTARVLTIDHRE